MPGYEEMNVEEKVEEVKDMLEKGQSYPCGHSSYSILSFLYALL